MWRLMWVLLLLASPISGTATTDHSSSEDGGHRSKAHFVLVHGAGHGAWAWFEVATMLEKAGYTATALDCTGGGISETSPDDVTSVADYSKPVVDYLSNVTEQVILVGHSSGGNPVSFAMEAHPEKVKKAVFLTALMQVTGSDILDPNSTYSKLLAGASGTPVFGNGPDAQPTSVAVNTSTAALRLFYNQSPPQVYALGRALLRATPYQSLFGTFNLTSARYGSVRRFFIRTGEDLSLPPAAQQLIIDSNPPEQVFTIEGSDHATFFSRPRELVRILKKIAKL
ncbi:hypothetical protein MPTK1_2g15700 [Marchantia polymorpha subsp. ruderalis]|uniref:AB hydrolase-1 domain-containing protein n=1 Tax=Marchantia polymorpha TaxID=3197 RepID=A0A2R6WK53_MARPO|nr:hypothetical protein MARPO_0082s0067 [Marchantia polymorpha]BBN02488.1 hypothetical protein Mp_2g15700 [Marchantia polymorpha subsp. ruderalis]|eukprot:PTQ34236.1 hypothetical protein MARPO_0082s0067 [Marchantia polymorpha]